MNKIKITEIHNNHDSPNEYHLEVNSFYPSKVAIEILKIHNELVEIHPDLNIFVDDFLKGLTRFEPIEMRFVRPSTTYIVNLI